MVDYTERRKTKRKKIKQSEIKFHQRLPQGKLPRRKERPNKTFFVFLCRMTFSKGRLNREKKEYEKKILNVPNQTSLESTSRKASTERRRTKKNFLCFYAECPSPMVDYTERRKKN